MSRTLSGEQLGTEQDLSGEVRAPSIPPGRLLLVDDDELNLRGFSRLLRREGHEVTVARSGAEAIGLIEERTFDLVVLDVLMPEQSGLEVLEILRRRWSLADLPIIMATGLDSTSDIVEALRLGANDYLTKPIDAGIAFARIRNQLELKHSRDQVQKLNRELRAAHEQVARLMGSSSSALNDVASWARAAARDVAKTIGVQAIGIWALDGERSTPLAPSSLAPPALVDLARILDGRPYERERDTVLPAIGFSGELVGAIVVPGNEGTWGELAGAILEALARQLGGALELHRARRELSTGPREGRERREPESPIGELDFVQVCPLCDACFDSTVRRCPRCGPGVVLNALWTVPRVIAGRYRLLRSLGAGGMATVFAALDERLGREVAVKVLKPEYCGDGVIHARFETEARAVARVRDEGVVAVHDCGDLPMGAFFIVMELLKGKELSFLLEKCGPGSPREIGLFLRQAASAVDAAHRAHIIHRDIKPGNFILIPGDGEVLFRTKILDFGVAKRFDADEQLTGDGIVVGTPMYMSPEQATGDDLDARTDIYSLAAVALHALTGRPPSRERNCMRVLVDVVRRRPIRVSEVLSDVPESVDEAFLWALSKDREARPKSVREWLSTFVEDLEAMPSPRLAWCGPEGLGGSA